MGGKRAFKTRLEKDRGPLHSRHSVARAEYASPANADILGYKHNYRVLVTLWRGRGSSSPRYSAWRGNVRCGGELNGPGRQPSDLLL